MAERFQKVTTSQEHETINKRCFILKTKKETDFAVKNCNG